MTTITLDHISKSFQRETVIGVEFLSALTAIAPDVRKALFERFPVVREALVKLHAAVA